MSTSSVTVKGYVTVIPRSSDDRRARVAITEDDVEYRILTKAAGVDLIDDVSAQVEAEGSVEEHDGIKYMVVRKYKLLEEDDGWGEN